jgi:hypothetical protein
MPSLEVTLLLPLQIEHLYFSWLTTLEEHLVLFWIEVMILSGHLSFPYLTGNFSVFHYYGTVNFLDVSFIMLKQIWSILSSVRVLLWNGDEFLHIYWHDHVTLILQSANVVQHIDWLPVLNHPCMQG